MISIDDGRTPFHQVTSYDSEERYRGLPARLSHYSPAMIQLLTPVPSGYFLSQNLHSCNFCPHVDGTYSKEMFSLIPFQVSDLFPELACSVVNITTRSQIPQEVTEEDTQEVASEPITSEAFSSDVIVQKPVHSPAEAFLKKSSMSNKSSPTMTNSFLVALLMKILA
ncbi:hypothetical protein P9112_005255 [Eukaryota sp. TZLM1-RC]